MIKIQYKVFIVILLISTTGLLAGCASSGSQRSSGGSQGEITDPSLTLADYLRRYSSVRVQGSGRNVQVFVRGSNNSVTGTNAPLFVVDGQRVGRQYSTVAGIVNVRDIASIDVLKGTEASSRYGMEGSNGVIVIRTKSR